MLELCTAFGSILLRRLGPEDLPASGFLLGLSMLLYVLTQTPIVYLQFGELGQPALSILAVDLALLVACLWLLLYFTGMRARYQQTLTAILGTSALLSLLSLPFVLLVRANIAATGGVAGVAVLPLWGILGWSLVVEGHILSRALSRSFGIGILIAIVYLFLETSLLFDMEQGRR